MKKRVLSAVSVCLILSMILVAAIAYADGAESSQSGKLKIDQKINSTNLITPSLKKAFDGKWSNIDSLNNMTVVVENCNESSESAYIRTIFAFEAGDLTLEAFHELLCIRVNVDDWSWPENSNWIEIDIDGEKYFMVAATCKTSVASGSSTPASLLGIGMDWTADNDVLSAAGFGDGLEIKTFSQASQATGFDDADAAFEATYGDVTEDKHPWNVVYVSTFSELLEAIKNGKNVVLIDDITVDQGSITFN